MLLQWSKSEINPGNPLGYKSPMARKPRIHYPGAVYHVILRGNTGKPIFFEDRDRHRLYLIQNK